MVSNRGALCRSHWVEFHSISFPGCREKGEELRAAVEEWQTKRQVPEPRLTTGFLDGVVPIVDSYELKVIVLSSVLSSVSVLASTR